MKVSHAPVYRRRRRVAAGILVGAVSLGAGFLTAELVGGRGDDAELAAASPSPTPEAASATPSPSASSSPSTTPGASVTPSPTPSPTPTFDTTQHSLTDPDSIWVIVNKLNPLDPAGYTPTDLETPEGMPTAATLRAEAADAMARMHADAVAAGAAFTVSTAYRSRDTQATLYNGYVARSGQARADTYSARPGYSEHQTGLAADVNDSGSCDLRICFGDTAAGLWIAEHAADYGFIVRYADGLSSVTGYQYEPWHVRYVGVELAQEMRRQGVATMEEFFGLPAAPDYAP